jgi:hypothetical protein
MGVRDRVAGLGAGAPAALGPRQHFLFHWLVVQHFLLILLGGWVYLRQLDLSLQLELLPKRSDLHIPF